MVRALLISLLRPLPVSVQPGTLGQCWRCPELNDNAKDNPCIETVPYSYPHLTSSARLRDRFYNSP